MLKLIKNAEVFAPKFLGKKDVLIAGGKICSISDSIVMKGNVEVEETDAMGQYLFPGFIDTHVHIVGGGGEGGFSTRTPEIAFSDMVEGGITTIIGTLGTDGYGRSMENLLAKAGALEEKGVTAFVNTGSYQVPVRTFTDSISKDIMFHEKIIGVGEIAISDHRCSCPTFDEIARIAAEARVAGMLSGKVGVVNIHVGDGQGGVDILEEIAQRTEIPRKHFIPTHMNRSGYVFEKGLQYLRNGGNLDFTTSTVPLFIEEGEIPCYEAIDRIIKEDLDISKVTLSSDGQGSLPIFDEKGNYRGVEIGRVTSLYQAVVECIKLKGIKIEQAISLITENPAKIYGLKGKGKIDVDFDADLVLVDKGDLTIDTVLAKGKILMKNKDILVKGVFEK